VSELLALVAGLGIGLALGGVGGGGSILTVPVLVYALGFTPHQATTASLVIVGLASASGAAGHARAGRVRGRTAVLFAAFAVPAAAAGAAASAAVSGRLLLVGFGILLLAAAWTIRRSAPAPLRRGADRRLVRTLAAGLGTGALTGFFGVGGGFLIVPALVVLLGLGMADAVGTSLAVIALTSVVALAVHLAATPIPWPPTLVFTAAAVLGAGAGARLGGLLPAERLTGAFAALAAGVAAVLVVAGLGAAV
jgi:uncharacterized protein